MSDDDLFGTRPRGAPAMGRRGGGERSTERASPALAADFADDASDEETARPPARRSGGWADEDAAGGIARDFDDASPLRAPRDGGVDGTPGGSASRRRMDSASKHDALEALWKADGDVVAADTALKASGADGTPSLAAGAGGTSGAASESAGARASESPAARAIESAGARASETGARAPTTHDARPWMLGSG